MDKEHWKRELFSVYSRNENEADLHNDAKSTLKPPKDGFLYATKEPLRESVISEQTRDNAYGNSKYYFPFSDKNIRFANPEFDDGYVCFIMCWILYPSLYR